MDHATMGHSMPAADAAGAAGRAMAGMDHGAAAQGAASGMDHAAMGHTMPGAAAGAMAGMDHGAGGMDHSMRDFSNAPGVKKTPTVQTISPMPVDRTGEPGQGLEDVGHKVQIGRAN